MRGWVGVSLKLLALQKWFTYQNLQNFTRKTARLFAKQKGEIAKFYVTCAICGHGLAGSRDSSTHFQRYFWKAGLTPAGSAFLLHRMRADCTTL